MLSIACIYIFVWSIGPWYEEYQTTYYDDLDSNFPVITLEVLSTDDLNNCNDNFYEHESTEKEACDTGVHFLSEKVSDNECSKSNDDSEDCKEASTKGDLLEYMIRNDGRVICKLCGEVLQSRTHWYRHKYKVHIIHPLNPAPLFQCEKCRVYFKSRKGYIGHISSRHSEELTDSSPILTNTQAEALSRETPVIQTTADIKDETDPEMSIPKTSVPNFQNAIQNIKSPTTKPSEIKRPYRVQNKGDSIKSASEWEEKRIREEKLVADIIARVRKECEAQGDGAARRGYSRRTTVMHS